jgi:hypothetical protein
MSRRAVRSNDHIKSIAENPKIFTAVTELFHHYDGTESCVMTDSLRGRLMIFYKGETDEGPPIMDGAAAIFFISFLIIAGWTLLEVQYVVHLRLIQFFLQIFGIFIVHI